MKHRTAIWLFTAICLFIGIENGKANNISVSNPVLCNQNKGAKYTFVKFDLSWDNSWRTDVNWDAAWVFVKFKPDGSNAWQHASLSTNNSVHIVPGGDLEVGLTGTNGVGVFIYRDSTGTGNVSYAKTQLRWNYGADGYEFQTGDKINISVQAIEMVYIPEGPFYLGSGGDETAHFYKYPTTTDTYPVNSEDAITVGITDGNLYYEPGGYAGDGVGPISNAFPKGYDAFYCMKYEISQGQYTEFLNKLDGTQDGTRYPDYYNSARYTITAPTTNHVAVVPDRACNQLNWADVSAYADWAALRLMTELEFEKACRGPETPVANEYAWGTNTIMADQSRTLSGAENGTETVINPSTAAGGANYGNKAHISSDAGKGPLRCGIFATNNCSRVAAGAGYYGVMELSGNVYERCVMVGDTDGRKFMGTHGDGVLDVGGNATGNTDWPDSNYGAGCRGGGWYFPGSLACVSVRGDGASRRADCSNNGGRAVRAAP